MSYAVGQKTDTTVEWTKPSADKLTWSKKEVFDNSVTLDTCGCTGANRVKYTNGCPKRYHPQLPARTIKNPNHQSCTCHARYDCVTTTYWYSYAGANLMDNWCSQSSFGALRYLACPGIHHDNDNYSDNPEKWWTNNKYKKKNCEAGFNADLSKWDVSSATNMAISTLPFQLSISFLFLYCFCISNFSSFLIFIKLIYL